MKENWLSTNELAAAVQMERRAFTYLKKKYGMALKPVKEIGGLHFWDPAVIPLVQDLLKRIKAYKPRAKEAKS